MFVLFFLKLFILCFNLSIFIKSELLNNLLFLIDLFFISTALAKQLKSIDFVVNKGILIKISKIILTICDKSVTWSFAEFLSKYGGNKFNLVDISSKTCISSLCNLILKKNLKLLFFICTIEKQPSASVNPTNQSNQSLFFKYKFVIINKELKQRNSKLISL